MSKNDNPNEKGYIRLYNLRNKEKNNLLKNENLLNTKKKKTIEERDKYLENLYKEGLNFMDKHEKDRINYLKEEKQMFSVKKNPWSESNKFFYEKVRQIFKNSIKILSIEKNNLYEINEENKFLDEEEKYTEKFAFSRNELQKFFYDFGFTQFDFSQENVENQEIIKQEELENDNEKKKSKTKPMLMEQERMLVNNFIDLAFIDNSDKIKSNDLFLYIVSILNLYDYFIYSSYKKKIKTEKNIENKLRKKQKTEKSLETIKEKEDLLNKIKQEIKNRISKQFSKYSGGDEDNNLILLDEHAILLNKDFHIFSLNFSTKHNIKSNLKEIKQELEIEFKKNNPFKPIIDKNSKKLYSDFRRKIIVTEVKGNNDLQDKILKDRKEYFNLLILRKQRKQK